MNRAGRLRKQLGADDPGGDISLDDPFSNGGVTTYGRDPQIKYPPEIESMPPGAWGPQGMPPIPSSAVQPSGVRGGQDVDVERLRADAYATIAAAPASEEAHAAREALARLPKVQVGAPMAGSVDEEPDQSMLIAQYMRGMR
jgi:hypothetical protein